VSFNLGWIGACLFSLLSASVAQNSCGPMKTLIRHSRPVAVADMIRTLHVAGPFPDSQYSPASDFAVFSPSKKYFVFAVSAGNITRNSNDYSLLLFSAAELPRAKPRILVSFSSLSNRAGISELRWGKNDDDIYFLGATGKHSTQLYSIRCSSGQLRQLTHHATSLESYTMSENGDVVFLADSPQFDVITKQVRRYGFDVTSENLADLIRGHIAKFDLQLFLQKTASERERRLDSAEPFDSGVNDLYLSPDGRFLITKTGVSDVPPLWSGYQDVNIQAALRPKVADRSSVRILQYQLIDTRTGKSRPLLDAPATFHSGDVLWAPDSRSLLLSGTYLPLYKGDVDSIEARRSTTFVIEITPNDGRFVELMPGDPKPIAWNKTTNTVQFRVREVQGGMSAPTGDFFFRKTASGWRQIVGQSANNLKRNPEIIVEQNANLAPRVAFIDPITMHKIPIWTLNPGFDHLVFGEVEKVQWQDSNGHTLNGGLYLPPDYDSHKRYPLVIQTHGFDPSAFSMSGYYNTAFAAQPLASKEIVVLQVNDIFYDLLQTPREALQAMIAYESAIRYLDQKGVIDPSRVGIVGFSRTSFYVKYALTHSSIRFAAAIVCDGFDAGYLQYVLFSNFLPLRDSEIEAVIGASPYRAGLPVWFQNSPGFLLDKVSAPVLIQAIGPTSLMGEWEWFSGLRGLQKPVDLIYIPTGTHILAKPWDRLVSQGATVDWFCFWLKGEENGWRKTNQYARWRGLRRQYQVPSSNDFQ
jgi:hypothetical protein